jgi:hypothetical protein
MLSVDFFDYCRHVRTFRCEIELFDSSVDNVVDFVGQAALATVRPLLSQEDRKAFGAFIPDFRFLSELPI